MIKKTTDEELKKEIIDFLNDIERVMSIKKSIPNNTGIEFSPFLFMQWRITNGRPTNNKREVPKVSKNTPTRNNLI